MTADVRREVFRKLLHMAMGLFALCLKWLAPWQAALCACAAIAHNLWIFPRYGMKKLERPEEKARGYSGMIGYPVVVLVLILLNLAPRYGSVSSYSALSHADIVCSYRLSLSIVAGAWAILAFGDAFAALAGLLLKGPALPWNPGKRWSGLAGFVAVGSLSSFLFMEFMLSAYLTGRPTFFSLDSRWALGLLCLLGNLAAAAVESLPGQIDDNLTVPVVAWAVLSGLGHLSVVSLDQAGPLFASGLHAGAPHGPQMTIFPPGLLFRTEWDTPSVLLFLLGLNLTLGLTAMALRWVSPPAGLLGLLFGFAVIAGMGSTGYAFLLLFYFLSHFSTYFGKRAKEARGIEEPHGGQRRSGSVFSKGLMPALFALVSPGAFFPAAAVYAADTVASEFGKTSRGRTFSLLGMRSVPAGTPGGVSLRGTVAGLACIGAFCAALVPVFRLLDGGPAGSSPVSFRFPHSTWLYALALCASCVFCFFLESVFNEWNSKRAYLSKEVIHIFTGLLAGALVFLPFKVPSLVAYAAALLTGAVP
jgi:uncharacterized protein (TIGR00297 family)